MSVTEVFYAGDRATNHKYGTIVPGINKLDSGIAAILLKEGFVSKPPKQKKEKLSGKTKLQEEVKIK